MENPHTTAIERRGGLGLIVQLGLLGASPYPVWTLTVLGLTLTLVVLYAPIVRWEEATKPVYNVNRCRGLRQGAVLARVKGEAV